MKMLGLKQALESLQSSSEEDFEASLDQRHEEMDARMQEHETASCALDGLSVMAAVASDLVENSSGTPETLALLSLLASPHFDAIKHPNVAFENYAGSVKEQHAIALEGIGENWQNSFQDFVLGFKHTKDFITDLFRNTNE